MKKIFVMMFALLTGIGAANAQEQVTTENGTQQVASNAERSAGTEQEPEKIVLEKRSIRRQRPMATSTTASRGNSRSTA